MPDVVINNSNEFITDILMAYAHFNDVMESYNFFVDWVLNGKENEDLGDSLEAELIENLRLFFFNGNEIDDSSIAFSSANSGLNIKVLGTSISLDLPNSSKTYDVRTILISA